MAEIAGSVGPLLRAAFRPAPSPLIAELPAGLWLAIRRPLAGTAARALLIAGLLALRALPLLAGLLASPGLLAWLLPLALLSAALLAAGLRSLALIALALLLALTRLLTLTWLLPLALLTLPLATLALLAAALLLALAPLGLASLLSFFALPFFPLALFTRLLSHAGGALQLLP